MKSWFVLSSLGLGVAVLTSAAEDRAPDNTPPAGFTALFNGKDLTGWQAAIPINLRDKLSPDDRAAKQKEADADVLPHWTVKDGAIFHDGKRGKYAWNLAAVKDYGNFELYVDWKIESKGDSGLYLRGNPQVQIWDGAINKGGSGGLFNNAKNPKDPLVNADRPAGEWNTFWIRMVGDKATIKLNGKLVVDNTPLENYWEKGKPLPARGPIELQHHGDRLWFKNIYVKELTE